MKELTKEQVEDLSLLADALDANEANNKIIKNIGAKYKDFVDEHFNELVEGVKVGKLWLKLKLSVKLLAEKFGCWAVALLGAALCGCSSLQPATKSQSMTVTALGFPAITVVTTTSQSAANEGDDEGANTQTTSADVKPDLDASVVPK